MDGNLGTSEIDRLLRGDLSDIEFLEDYEDDEEDIFISDEALQDRIEEFEAHLFQLDISVEREQLSEERQENGDAPNPIDPEAEIVPGDNNLHVGEEAPENEDAPLPIDNLDTGNDDLDAVPLFNRLTRKKQNEWKTQWEIRRWRTINQSDDFSQQPSRVQLPPPPQEVLLPKEYFDLMFDRSIIENLVEQTNLYSVQKTGNSINTTFSEMEQFLGMHVLSGIIQMPSYRMFWADETRYPIIADIMPRNRFDSLRTYLHVNNNDNATAPNHPNHDKLFKVRPLVDKVRENFTKIDVEEKLCVDEMIIPFKGRSTMKQYIKNKPHKWGLKVFALASKSGIVHDFQIYIGKGTVQEQKLGISGDIVVRLANIIPKNNNHKIYTDNWFTSHALFCELKTIGILATGTVKENRSGRCPYISSKILMKQERGTYDIKVDADNKVVACKWLDNKIVCLLSTYVAEEPVTNVNRWSNATKQNIAVPRPAIVQDYNSAMGGVDLHDMLVELYRIDFRAKRYYMRIIYHLIDMSIVNAWLVYRRHWEQLEMPGKYMSLLKFKTIIGRALLSSGHNKTKRKPGRPSNDAPPQDQQRRKKYKISPRPVAEVRFDNIDHWPIPVETGLKQRCKQCIKFYATTKCSKCNMFLCLNTNRNCFVQFHRKP